MAALVIIVTVFGIFAIEIAVSMLTGGAARRRRLQRSWRMATAKSRAAARRLGFRG